MKTRRLYYEDCHLREFAATVTSCRETEKGFLVELDATAFYPEGGGQACDLGTLADAKVLDVREKENAIVHLCDKPLAAGQQVAGKIDWQRRFDLMQQHTGEHIVSGILHKMFGCHNVGFHVGADTVTIDFDALIPVEALPEIEKQANQAVYQNLPVRCWYPSPEELPGVTYRSKRELPWPVRIVQIPDVDSCACCGVHTEFTGEVGIIKLLSCVKFHQGVRMEMVCGGRAFEILSSVYEQNRLVCKAFSAKMLETGAAAQRMNDTLAAEKFRAAGLERQVFDAVAAGYTGQGDAVHFAEGLTSAAVRDLAERIAQVCGGTAAVFSGEDAQGYSMCLVGQPDGTQELGKMLCQQLDGRGGGKAGFFQGNVKGTKEQILKIVKPEKM
jgi:alanyl-tRNA synthetase